MDRSSAHFTGKLVEVQQIKEIVGLTAERLTQLGFELSLLDSEFLPPYRSAPQRDRRRTCLDAFLWLYLKIQGHVLHFFDFSSPFVSCL